MRGILGVGAHVPHHRLERAAIAAFSGGTGGAGTRTVAGYDEDTVTMAVAAARTTLARADVAPTQLWFATADPPLLDRTNATTIHAALRLDRDVLAADAGGAPRSGIATLLAAARGTVPVLVAAADIRIGLPGGADEREGGDAAAAVLVGDSADGPLSAAIVGAASVTQEHLDRWRVPGERVSRRWEERFGETQLVPLAEEAAKAACAAAGVELAAVDRIAVTGPHARATERARRVLSRDDQRIDDLTATVGQTGTAHPLLLLAAELETPGPERTVLLVSLSDGADALLLRTTGTGDGDDTSTVAAQIAAGDTALPYARALAWRGLLTPEPPNRPPPARASATAAARNRDWKYGFVGDRAPEDGRPLLPPTARDDLAAAPMADVPATIATFTVDRLAWSPSPPTVFAVLDFDGGGRFACELTDVDPDALAIGDRVTMVFRRLNQAEGIPNYGWKARPLPRREAS